MTVSTSFCFCRQLRHNPPASLAAIAAVEAQIGVKLTDEHRQLLLTCDGFDGYVNELNYVSIWNCSELPRLNEAYEATVNAPGFLLIGSDGCGDALAYDYHHADRPLMSIPFVGMRREHAIVKAKYLLQYFQAMKPLSPQPPVRQSENEIVELKPIIFGGHPTDRSNKTYLNRESHIQFVRFWNKLYRDVTRREPNHL